MERILWYITVAVSVMYIGYIWIRYGVQKSISASYHNLETPVKKSLYAWFIFGVALPLMIISNCTLGVLAGMFLAIDFAAPTGGSKLQMFLHSLGANVGMILGMAMLGFVFGQWWLVGITGLIILSLVLFEVKNKTWWVECAILAAVLIGLYIR